VVVQDDPAPVTVTVPVEPEFTPMSPPPLLLTVPQGSAGNHLKSNG
jgi:hypothetical protein